MLDASLDVSDSTPGFGFKKSVGPVPSAGELRGRRRILAGYGISDGKVPQARNFFGLTLDEQTIKLL